MLLSINPLWVLGWIQNVPMSELKGCLVSTGSVDCWAVLTHVIGFRLSMWFRLVRVALS